MREPCISTPRHRRPPSRPFLASLAKECDVFLIPRAKARARRRNWTINFHRARRGVPMSLRITAEIPRIYFARPFGVFNVRVYGVSRLRGWKKDLRGGPASSLSKIYFGNIGVSVNSRRVTRQ